MEYTLGLDLGGGSVTVAVSGPEGEHGPQTEVLTVVGTGERVNRLLDRLGRPSTGRVETDSRAAPGTVRSELSALVAAATEVAVDTHGAPPAGLVVAHPSSWGPYRVDLLRAALTDAVSPVAFVPAAVAAVTHAGTSATLRAGDLVAVLDVRDEHVEISVVRAGGDRAAGTPVGMPRAIANLGALDVDDAVLAHVRAVLAEEGTEVARADGARLRAACQQAGSELATAAATTVTWQTDAGQHEVRIVGSELDARLRPRAVRAVAAAADAVATDARTGVDRVLLTGRVAAMPLLTELVAERFEAPLTVLTADSHPVARGAALLGHEVRGTAVTPEPAAARATRGRRAHVRHPPRRPARMAALLGSGVIALGVAALAVSGAALASPGGTDDRPGGTSSPAIVSPLEAPQAVPGIGAAGSAPVLGPPALPGPARLEAGLPPHDLLAHTVAPRTGEQQASAG